MQGTGFLNRKYNFLTDFLIGARRLILLLACHHPKKTMSNAMDTPYPNALSFPQNERSHPVMINQEQIIIQRAYGIII
jgi:hypothetical protein